MPRTNLQGEMVSDEKLVRPAASPRLAKCVVWVFCFYTFMARFWRGTGGPYINKFRRFLRDTDVRTYGVSLSSAAELVVASKSRW